MDEYTTNVDVDGDGNLDEHDVTHNADGGVTITADQNDDGVHDFTATDFNADGVVDQAGYDTDMDSTVDTTMYDDNGDGYLDRSQASPAEPSVDGDAGVDSGQANYESSGVTIQATATSEPLSANTGLDIANDLRTIELPNTELPSDLPEPDAASDLPESHASTDLPDVSTDLPETDDSTGQLPGQYPSHDDSAAQADEDESQYSDLETEELEEPTDGVAAGDETAPAPSESEDKPATEAASAQSEGDYPGVFRS